MYACMNVCMYVFTRACVHACNIYNINIPLGEDFLRKKTCLFLQHNKKITNVYIFILESKTNVL